MDDELTISDLDTARVGFLVDGLRLTVAAVDAYVGLRLTEAEELHNQALEALDLAIRCGRMIQARAREIGRDGNDSS